MKIDIFEIWTPIQGLPSRLYCEGLHDDYEGFRILLQGEKKSSRILRIMFDRPLIYRNSDEGDRLKTLESISDTANSSLFTVRNSTWIEWFHEESVGIHRNKNIVHYAIYTPNDCIDILSEFEPAIQWLSEG